MIRRLACILGIAACASSVVAAPTIYLNDNQGDFGTITTAGVYHQIGVTRYVTGAPLVMGDIGVSQSGDVYGTDFYSGGLYQISTVDASTTFIGTLGFSPNGGTIGVNNVYYADDLAGNFYAIDLATAAATLIGNMGTGVDGDFQFDSNGSLWITGGGALWNVNVSTGAATEIGTGMGASEGIWGLAWQNGVLYGFGASQNVYSISRTTGLATEIVTGFTGDPLAGEVFGSDTAAVPEPLTLVALGAALVPLIRRRRK